MIFVLIDILSSGLPDEYDCGVFVPSWPGNDQRGHVAGFILPEIRRSMFGLRRISHLIQRRGAKNSSPLFEKQEELCSKAILPPALLCICITPWLHIFSKDQVWPFLREWPSCFCDPARAPFFPHLLLSA